jgi:hypothetical protein
LAIWWNHTANEIVFVEDLTAFNVGVNQGGVRQFGVDDIDGDGLTDVLVVGGRDTTGFATIYMGQNNGTFCPVEVFTPQTALVTEESPGAAVIMAGHFMDLDGEDWLDFVVTRYRHINEIWQTD